MMKCLGNLFKGENCGILFFVAAFVFLFANNGMLSSSSEESDEFPMIFFIVLFLLLFLSNKECSVSD